MHKMIDHEGVSVWKENPITNDSSDVIVMHSFDALRAAAEDTNAAKQARKELASFLKEIEAIEAKTLQARESAEKERV
jgi:hypothetical protein